MARRLYTIRKRARRLGIDISDSWLNSVDDFINDMGYPADITLSVDRIDNSLGYCKENCRWATPSQQARNRTTVLMIQAFGETLSAPDWSDRLGVPCHTIIRRIRNGVPPDEAVSKQTGRSPKRKRTPPANEYRIWYHMRRRCNIKKDKSFQDYGGRGIQVCDSWNASFEEFLNDMGPRPGPDFSLDRIDVNGNYEPENCRWADKYQQSRNRRSSIFLTIDGVTKTTIEWSRHPGVVVQDQTIVKRHHSGWSDRDAVFGENRNKPRSIASCLHN